MVGMRNSPQDVSSYLRKIRKPMVEKQRRERMNHSISQLKLLIASTIKQQMAPMTRVDKADILELTVYHLTKLLQQQKSVTMATEVEASNTGFKDCAREAVTYLSTKQLTNDKTTSCLSSQLQSVYMMKSSRRQNLGERLSTPLRTADTSNTFTSDSPAIDFSPIIPFTGSRVVGRVGEVSPASVSSESLSYSLSDSDSYASGMSVSIDTSSTSIDSSDEIIDVTSDVVTIGDGKENEIGHVISDSVWRPWQIA